MPEGLCLALIGNFQHCLIHFLALPFSEISPSEMDLESCTGRWDYLGHVHNVYSYEFDDGRK